MFANSKSKFCAVTLAAATLLAAGCASIGTPGGGLYDETPPALRTTDPHDGELNVKKKKFTLRFDENVKLDNVMDKMTVSPPQEKAPTVLSNAKTVTIELQDSLKANTTYSISLGDAVQDNNEGNVLEHCSFTFSTGDHIDSLRISGFLLRGEDLEPVTGAFVGIYPADDVPTAAADGAVQAQSLALRDSLSADSLQADTLLRRPENPDSAFVTRPFLRAGKTDALGAFTIEGVARGSYRLYALLDGNTNYRYDLTSEDIAFLDTLVTPTMHGTLVHDTLWNATDTTVVDTVLTHGHVVYAPTGLTLLMFNEGRATRYMDDYARPDSNHITFRFSAPMDSLPTLRLVYASADTLEAHAPRDAAGLPQAASGPTDSLSVAPADRWTDGRWAVAEPNPTRDTLTYWLRDSALYRSDTLRIAVTYAYTDTAGLDVPRTDTLTLLKPIARAAKDDRKDDKKKGRRRKKDADSDSAAVRLPETVFMTLKQFGQNPIHIGERPRFEVSAPLDSLRLDGLHLEHQVNDSTWEAMAFRWEADTTHLRRFRLQAEPHFTPGHAYRLLVDSAAMHDIYGHPVAATKIDFKERSVEEYAHLLFSVAGIEAGVPAFMQLVNEKDKPVQAAPVEGGKAKFVNVMPGKYYARLVVDTNGNGRYDGGSLFPRRQPEAVYYFNAQLDLRANWSVSQEWNVRSLPLVRQKPEEVKVNKPKEKQQKESKNAEYYKKMGKTPPQTHTGTTTTGGSDRLHPVR